MKKGTANSSNTKAVTTEKKLSTLPADVNKVTPSLSHDSQQSMHDIDNYNTFAAANDKKGTLMHQKTVSQGVNMPLMTHPETYSEGQKLLNNVPPTSTIKGNEILNDQSSKMELL